MYGVASCRFAFVDFTSDRGGFEDFYFDPTADGSPIQYRAGIGLFQRLVPFDPEDWSDGSCAGYTTLQREAFSDQLFEISRIFAVLTVLGGISVTIWSLFLACLSLGKWQIRVMTFILILLSLLCGMTFILFQAQLCQDLVSDQDESYTTKCTVDQGGLVVIAATILWAVAALICYVYIKPPEVDMRISNGQITNAHEQRRRQRQKQRMLAERKRQLAKGGSPSKVRSATDYRGRPIASPSRVRIGGDGANTEVQLRGTASEI